MTTLRSSRPEVVDNLMSGNEYLDSVRSGHNGFWRYLVVVILMVGASLVASLVLLVGAFLVEGGGQFDLGSLSQTTLLLVTMLPFPAALWMLWIGQTLIHRRPMRLLVNPFGRIRWRYLLVSGGVWFGLSAASDLVLSLLQPGNYAWTFNFKAFLPFLLLSLLLVPLQASTEELIFRGYLAQGLSLFNGGVWPSLVFPALLFGALHGANPEVGAYGILLTLPYYVVFGLLAGWLTLRSRGLELSIGMHIANNLYASLIVTFQSSAIPSPALFSIKQYQAELALVVYAVCTLAYLLVLWPMLRKMPSLVVKTPLPGLVGPADEAHEEERGSR